MNTWISREDRTLLEKRINETIRNNSHYIITSVVVMMIVTVVLTSILGVLMILTVGGFSASAATLIPSIVIGYLSLLVTVLLCYGFSVLLGRFYRKERAVIGYLFWGFHDLKRIAPIPALMYAVILALAMVFSFCVLPFIPDYLSVNTDSPSSVMSMAIFVLIPVVIITGLIMFQYFHTFCILYEHREMPLRAALKQSRQMLKKKKWRTFWFTIWMMRVPLLVWFVCIMLLGVFIDTNVVSTLLSTVSRVAVYFMLIYQLLTWNALYYYETDPDFLRLGEKPDQDGQNVQNPIQLEAPIETSVPEDSQTAEDTER